MGQPSRKDVPLRLSDRTQGLAAFLAQQICRPGTVTILCALGVVGLTILAAVPLFRWQINVQDEGLLLAYSDRLLHGALPHRDYFTAYGPGGFWLMAGAFKLFGSSLVVERCLGLTYRLAIIMAVFCFGIRKGRIVAVTGSLLCGTLLGPAYQ